MNNALEKFKKKNKGDLTTSSTSLSTLRSTLVSKKSLDDRVHSMAARVLPTAALELQQKKNTLELVNIFDNSSSCSGLEEATSKGYNDLIKNEKNSDGSTVVTTSLFSDNEQLLYEGLDVKLVPSLSYSAYGNTALYDTLANRLNAVLQRHQKLGKTAPTHTIVTIMTDGLDNSSHFNTLSEVRQIILKCRNLGWEFIFLGANIDAKTIANDLGILPKNAENFDPSPRGLLVNFKALEAAIKSVKDTGRLSADWSEAIRKNNQLALGNGNDRFLLEDGHHKSKRKRR